MKPPTSEDQLELGKKTKSRFGDRYYTHRSPLRVIAVGDFGVHFFVEL